MSTATADSPAAIPASPKAVHTTIAWWLAAGLVGADIGTSVFYSTGVLWPHVGFAGPFFVLAICIFMWLFKSTYQEGCAVSPLNGGAYTMVLQTIGRRSALVVGSLTILSYLATAVVSALSGSLYLATLWQGGWPTWLVVMVAAVPIAVFAFLNVIGLKESMRIVFAIAAFHFGMLIVMDVWGIYMLSTHEVHWERLWNGFSGTVDGVQTSFPGLFQLDMKGIVLGFAFAFLGITGFESAAQIIEEIEQPNWRAVQKVYLTIVGLVFFTSPVSSILALLLLEPTEIVHHRESLMSALAFVEGGSTMRTLLVLNACLTLFAAVNTAFAGATGLMTTMGKQGNLPGIVLKKWSHISASFKGFPYVALPFAGLCVLMLVAFPGSVDKLGAIYGMAFLAVMASYCIGVVLLRMHQPKKVERAPWVSKLTMSFKGTRIPIAPVLGAAMLIAAELTQLVHEQDARDLGVQLFLAVLLVMVYYRLGQIEQRMVSLPDLRLGLGKYRNLETLPDLPTYVLCSKDANANNLVTHISYLMRTYGENIEIVVFHAEDQHEPHGMISSGLERLVSQQLEDFYENRDLILGVKVLPGSLVEVLPEYSKTRKMERVFISTGHDSVVSEELRNHLANELGWDVVRLEPQALPKGPGVWFTQWSQGLRRRERNWNTEDLSPGEGGD